MLNKKYMWKTPDIIIEISRELRKKMTSSERILWDILKAKKFNNIKFFDNFQFMYLQMMID